MVNGEAPSTNLFRRFSDALSREPEQTFLVDPLTGRQLSRREFAQSAGRLAHGLRSYTSKGRAVGLLMGNRTEFYLCDFAILLAGGVPVSLYPTSSAEQILEYIEDANLEVIFVEQSRMQTLTRALELAPETRLTVIAVDPASLEVEGLAARPLWLDDLMNSGNEVSLEQRAATCAKDDLLTIIYTSGTTGRPKGACLTHDNVLAAIDAMVADAGLQENDSVISWLPHAHVAERTCIYYCGLSLGLRITVCADSKTLPELLRKVQPTWFGAIPRFWEKLKDGAATYLGKLAANQKLTLQEALRDGLELHKLRAEGQRPDAELQQRTQLAESIYWLPVRQALGLARARFLAVGSAPTPLNVLEFFASIGLPLHQIYGATETCTCGTVERSNAFRVGSVGRPSLGIELRIAPDDEILLRGRSVIRRYWRSSGPPNNATDTNGWYSTGDLGRVDADGYLWVTGRKKDLIINSSGHNMSPQRIEAVLYEEVPAIAHVVVIGDCRPFNTALLVFEAPEVAWTWPGPADDRSEDIQLILSAVGRANSRLARVEQIKRFRILRASWIPGSEEITPTMKIRRSAIIKKYTQEINEMYAAGTDLQYFEPEAS